MEQPKNWEAEELTRVDLDEGYAEVMGDGMFVVFQTIGERTFSVALSADDLAKLLALA